MKYKLIDSAVDPSSLTPLEDYLRAVGVESVDRFINQPTYEDELSWKLIENMEKAVDMLHKHIEQDSIIHLVVDSDTDGYTSAAITYRFIKQIHPEAVIDCFIHTGKTHGVSPKDVKVGTGLIIVPDAGSNQKEEMEFLAQNHDILIIDHHLTDIDLNSEKIALINNQLSPKFTNKSLSGAGMVYKFIQAYSELKGCGNGYKNFMDLAAVGIVADMMDSRVLDNNFLIYYGLRNIKNPMLQALLVQREYSVSSTVEPTKIDIAFYIAPIINGLIRFGEMEEKRALFNGFAGIDTEGTTERVYRGETKIENYFQRVARESSNIKARQDNYIKKLIPQIENMLETSGMSENQVIICEVPIDMQVPREVTGLVASRISNKYKKPTLLVMESIDEDGNIQIGGSGRGFVVEGFDSFKDFLNETGKVTFAEGHDSAFGVMLPRENVGDIIETANLNLKDVDFGTTEYEVIADFKNGGNPYFLRPFAIANHLYGNGIPEPLFAIEITASADDITVMGRNQDVVKIEHGGITYIRFNAKEWANELKNLMGTTKIKVVAKAQINEYRGYKNLQMNILDSKILGEEVSMF